MPHVLVWDIETIPDISGFAAANGLDGKSDDEVPTEMGDKFPKHGEVAHDQLLPDKPPSLPASAIRSRK
jgi:hypothetical protein